MSSASTCELCGGNANAEHGRWGQLLGPISMGRTPESAVFVHRLCALWSSEVRVSCIMLSLSSRHLH